LRPFTVVRTRGFVHWSVDQSVSTESPFGALSAQVVTDSAAASGASAIPTPVTETNADFFLYVPLVDGIIVATGTQVGEIMTGGSTFEFDSKSMRKVGTDDDVVFVVENESASAGAQVIMGGRMLVKLL